MNQDGMPFRFRAHINANTTIHFVLEDIVNPNALFSIRELLMSWLLAGNIPDQAIGATDSSDPKQELYLGDVIGFWFKDLEKPTIGLLIWDEYGVMVKYKIHPDESAFSYAHFYAVEYHTELIRRKPIKKLGSRYDLKMKEILEKAGLCGERR